MTRPIDAALNELADEFELLGDWEERYRYVIELGRTLAPLAEAERSEANKVRGCASQVWLVTEPQTDGSIVFRGDSDAHIVSGLIAIVLRLYSGRPAADIA
ncbi:SufE family protein, partial [Caulobacter sp. HMWF009]